MKTDMHADSRKSLTSCTAFTASLHTALSSPPWASPSAAALPSSDWMALIRASISLRDGTAAVQDMRDMMWSGSAEGKGMGIGGWINEKVVLCRRDEVGRELKITKE